MKHPRNLILVVVAVVILGGVVGAMIAKRQAPHGVASQTGRVAEAELAKSEAQAAATPAVAPATTEVVAPQEPSPPPPTPQRLKPVQATAQTKSASQKPAVAQTSPGGPPVKQPLRDPLARVALAWVGADAEAEAYWYAAINDPSLAAHEREDLIEDLNEDGLSDPKHPTVDDLPLIVSRLVIIQQVAPDAMDDVNADAFQEAYKDLVNLANVALGGGEPVR